MGTNEIVKGQTQVEMAGKAPYARVSLHMFVGHPTCDKKLTLSWRDSGRWFFVFLVPASAIKNSMISWKVGLKATKIMITNARCLLLKCKLA